jgi:predicted glycosyltransferase
MIYVQHLLGIGHLQRSILLAAELARHDFSVELVSGGRPQAMTMPAGVQLHQLPPVYSPDGSFTRLLDRQGNAIDADLRERRKLQLLEIFASCAPQVLITETFPFGRRMMRFELIPLLEAARTSTICTQVIASVRDILQPKSRAGRNEEICDLVTEFYDHVLVHGDRKIAGLEESFPLADRISGKIYYSGYVCDTRQTAPVTADGSDEVLISAGGSPTGLDILTAAIEAKPMSILSNLQWRILVSPSIDESDLDALQRVAGEGIIIERNRPDFSELVKRARLSISQAGYNTITDILNSSTAAVVIPYAEADEIEQTMRAQRLHRLDRLVMLRQSELSAENLASAIEQADRQSPSLEVNLNGAANSADRISQWLQAALTAT